MWIKWKRVVGSMNFTTKIGLRTFRDLFANISLWFAQKSLSNLEWIVAIKKNTNRIYTHTHTSVSPSKETNMKIKRSLLLLSLLFREVLMFLFCSLCVEKHNEKTKQNTTAHTHHWTTTEISTYKLESVYWPFCSFCFILVVSSSLFLVFIVCDHIFVGYAYDVYLPHIYKTLAFAVWTYSVQGKTRSFHITPWYLTWL